MVLRNHEDLPDKVGHDVDILVHPKDEPRIDGLVREVVHRRGLFLVQAHRGANLHTFFDVAAADLHGRFLLHVDVQTAARHRGRLLIDADDLLAHRYRVRDLWVPMPGIEAYALLLHAALHKAELKDRYAERLVALDQAEPGGSLRIATERLGSELARRVTSVRTESQLLALRRDLGRAIDRRYPGNVARRLLFNFRSGSATIKALVRPRGVFVAFLGPDGAGKSSTTDLLTTMLRAPSDVLGVHRVYLGSGTPLLPTRRLMQALHARTGRVDKKQRVRDVAPRRLRGALHVMADEILRYWVHVRPRLAPSGIVLADRYAYDIFRVNNQMVSRLWFRRLVTAIIPEPNITFFLDGDPAMIVARKGELTLSETVRQHDAYRALADFVPGFRRIDLTVRDDRALRGVALVILDAFAARNGGLARSAGGSPAAAS